MATAPIIVSEIVSRTYDADAINAVCNHPDVLPTLSLGHGEIDVSDLIESDRNIFFLGEHGGAMFHWCAPGVYAAHDFFMPQGRGRWALHASRFMLNTMFAQYRARLIWAETPTDNRACRMFNRWLGFKSEGVSRSPGGYDAEYFVMEAR